MQGQPVEHEFVVGDAPDRVEEAKRDWIRSIVVDDADAILFRFDVLLKALDRFFNVSNHPPRRNGEVSIGDNLINEVGIADRVLRELIRLAQSVLDETDTSALMFRSYVEGQLISDHERDAVYSRSRQQETPEESFYLLQVGLCNLAQLTAGLRRADTVELPVFRALGHQYASLLWRNRYFNPLRTRTFNALYDRVENPLLSSAVHAASSEPLRRGIGFVILAFNRYLKILRWIHPDAPSREALHDTLPVLALLNSEYRSLQPYIERSLPRHLLPSGPQTEDEGEFVERLDAVAFQLSFECRKTFEQILVDFSTTQAVGKLQMMLETVQGVLVTFLQQSVVQLVQVVLPDVEGRDLYVDFVSRHAQSVRLREELWIFERIVAEVRGCLAGDATVFARRPDASSKLSAFRTLSGYVDLFEHSSLHLVRRADLEAFEQFFRRLRSVRDDEELLASRNRSLELARDFEHFRIFLETTRGLVDNRADLQAVPLDEEHAAAVASRILDEGRRG